SSHVSSHASHWTGGHHYSTHYSGHTHTTGHTRTTNVSKTNLSKSNLSKSNLNKSNLSHANVTNHALTNQGKNLNSHVTPIKHAADPHNFGVRRAFANKAAFQHFCHAG